VFCNDESLFRLIPVERLVWGALYIVSALMMLARPWQAVRPQLETGTINWDQSLKSLPGIFGRGFLMLIAEVFYVGQCT
jgi:hypothetical protein